MLVTPIILSHLSNLASPFKIFHESVTPTTELQSRTGFPFYVSKQLQNFLLAMSLHTLITSFSLCLIYASIVVNSSMDPYKALNIILNPNGTLTRLNTSAQTPPSPDPNLPTQVLSKDITINKSKQTWARIYIHHKALDYPPNLKQPLIAFFHGGGFIFDTANSTYFHDFCVRMVNNTQSVVVSLTYRLAPEHRLPAAYDDSVELLHWIKTSKDAWLRHADYSRVYLMGESAGGNIAYTAGLRAAAEVDRIKPLKIQALVLIQPFFGGVKRSPSEVRLAEDTTIPLPITDLMWNLSLPVGVDRDYEYSNPTVNGGAAKVLDKIKVLEWRVAVFGAEGDPLVDRERDLVNLLQEKGVHAVGQFYEGGRHGIFVGDPYMSLKVFDLVKSLHS